MSKKERVKGKGADIFFSEKKAEDVERAVALPHLKDELSKADSDCFGSLATLSSTEELATKATFYFQKSQLDALEKAVFLLSQEHRIKTNKSEVMRIAIDMITKDFLENRKDSALYERLAERRSG